MIVSDTSPLNYLVQIGHIDVLPVLFEHVAIREIVLMELAHPGAPESVRRWSGQLPSWLVIHRGVQRSALLSQKLHAGEAAAISLALGIRAPLILMDERPGRNEAARVGVRVFGTLSVLEGAEYEGLLNFDRALERLREVGFRVSDDVIAAVRARGGHRR